MQDMIYEIETTAVFDKWARKLKDKIAARSIAFRLARVRAGNQGDVVEVLVVESVKCGFLWVRVTVCISLLERSS